MALNVKDIEVMEEKTNVLDHILLFILVYTLVLHVISSNWDIAVVSFHFEKPSFVKHVMFSL